LIEAKSNKASINFEAEIKSKASCGCPGSEPGKIKMDPQAHLPGCLFRKKLQTGGFTTDTSATPDSWNNGYSLGVAV
jgi:hypothetical protein